MDTTNYKFNSGARRAVTLVPTSVPEVFLEVITSHYQGSFINRVDRIKSNGQFSTKKIDAERFHDTPPIPLSSVAQRYSQKRHRESHESFLGSITDEKLAEALVWAERF